MDHNEEPSHERWPSLAERIGRSVQQGPKPEQPLIINVDTKGAGAQMFTVS